MNESVNWQIPEINNRRLALATLVVVAVGAIFWFLFRFYQTVFILFVALVIATAIRPILHRLQQIGAPRRAGLITIYATLVAAILLFTVLAVPPLIEQTRTLTQTIEALYGRFREALVSTPNLIAWRIGIEMPEALPLPQPIAIDSAGMATTIAQVWEYLTQFGKTSFSVIATFLLAFYWGLDGEKVKRTCLLLLPPERRENTRQMIATIEYKTSQYVAGQTVLCVFVGLLAFAAYLLIGLPHAFVLALFAGLMEAIPYLGPTLGAVPALLTAITIAPATAFWVVVATLVIQQVENNLLVPRIMKQAVGLNPLVTLLAITTFGSLFGVVGAVVAIPLAAIVQLVLDEYLLDPENREQNQQDGRDHISVLRYQTQELIKDLRKHFREKEGIILSTEDEIESELEAIATELDVILAQRRIQEDPT